MQIQQTWSCGGGGVAKDRVRWRQTIGRGHPCSDGLKGGGDCALDADGATLRISLSVGSTAFWATLVQNTCSLAHSPKTHKKRCKVDLRAKKQKTFLQWRALSQ